MLAKLWRQNSILRLSHYRTLVTATSNDAIINTETPKPRQIRRRKVDLTEPNISKEILAHFNVPDRQFVLKSFAADLLKKRRMVVQGLYIADRDTAEVIGNNVLKNLRPDQSLMEMNPGLGLVTKRLLNESENDLLLYEPSTDFHPRLKVS